MKEQIEKLMNEYLISSKEELLMAIEFIAELIDLELVHDEKKYPNATRSHEASKSARGIVNELTDFVEEYLK